MDTSYVAEWNGANLEKVLLRMRYLVHTVVPEMFWKEYGLNKLGVLLHPISVCRGAFGSLYVVDYSLGSLFQVRLHNPADVQVLARDILNPTCVIYESGVIFVTQEDSLSYLDVFGREIKSQSTEKASATRRAPQAWPARPRRLWRILLHLQKVMD